MIIRSALHYAVSVINPAFSQKHVQFIATNDFAVDLIHTRAEGLNKMKYRHILYILLYSPVLFKPGPHTLNTEHAAPPAGSFQEVLGTGE